MEKPQKPQILADLGRATARRTASVFSSQRTQRGGAEGGPCVRARRTSGPGACRGVRAHGLARRVQEMQEIQEIQERGERRFARRLTPPTTLQEMQEIQEIQERGERRFARRLTPPWLTTALQEIQERPCGAMGGSFRENGDARNGGRRARSAAKPQSDRWSPKWFAPYRYKKDVGCGAKPLPESQASKLPNFQAPNFRLFVILSGFLGRS